MVDVMDVMDAVDVVDATAVVTATIVIIVVDITIVTTEIIRAQMRENYVKGRVRTLENKITVPVPLELKI